MRHNMRRTFLRGQTKKYQETPIRLLTLPPDSGKPFFPVGV